jgi:hypothetical protein
VSPVPVLPRLTFGKGSQWAELRFHGTQVDGTKHVTRGVTISGIKGIQIAWAKLYIETVFEP